MQPYFFPYIGYFQLMNAVDEFIVYDNIEFTKKGWINRNRILVNGEDAYITLPLKKDSDYLDIKDRFLADTWTQERVKMLNRIKDSYRKAPQFKEVFPLIESCILFEEKNLFNFIFNTIHQIKSHFRIATVLKKSSEISFDNTLKSEEKVIAICKSIEAKQYINPIGGITLYDSVRFSKENIELTFIKPEPQPYFQFENPFVPYLSILDVMMFNDSDKCSQMLSSFRLLSGVDIKKEIAHIEENNNK